MPAPYTDDYTEQAFYVWYENNKPGSHKLVNLLPKNDGGNSPARMVIERWMNEKGWRERADALDAEISIQRDNIIKDKRMEMWERLEEIGKEEAEMGFAFLKEHGIQKEETALRAISDGVTLMQKAVGGAELWQKLTSMTDDQLTKELLKLTGKTPKNEFDIDADVEDLGESINNDTESNDIT